MHSFFVFMYSRVHRDYDRLIHAQGSYQMSIKCVVSELNLNQNKPHGPVHKTK